MDGGDLGDATDSFLLGSIAGLALGAVFNAAASGLGKLVNKIPVLKRIKTVIAQKGDDILKKILQKFGQYVDSASEAIPKLTSKKITTIAEETNADPLLLEISSKSADEQFFDDLAPEKVLADLEKNTPSVKNKNFDMYDLTGTKLITKDELMSNGCNARLKLKGTIADIAQRRFDISHIDYVAGWPQFPSLEEVIADVTSNRSSNITNFDKLFAKGLRENTITPSDEIKSYFARKGIDLANVKTSDITKMRSKSELNLTWHEIYDPIFGIKAILTDHDLHTCIKHYGGVGIAKLNNTVISACNKSYIRAAYSLFPKPSTAA